jgi:hypothetical protein
MKDGTKGSIWHGGRVRLEGLWQRALKPWWRDYQWILLALAWVVAIYLGYVGFARYTSTRGRPASWLDLLYFTLQLASLESGAVSPPIPLALQIARWLLPALTLYTAARALAGLFHEQLQLVRLWSIRDHVIICGAGRKGLLLARGFRQEGASVVVIGREENNELLEQFRACGTIVLVGDATSAPLLCKAAVHRAKILISVCGDDAVNAEVAVRAQDLVADRPASALTCIIHIVDPQLCELLREREIGPAPVSGFRLELFNIFDRGARLMVSEVPIPDQAAEVSRCGPHLLVVGLGKLGESLVLYAAQGWRDRPFATERRLRITVIDREAEARCESLEVCYPGLKAVCDLVPLEIEVQSPAFQRAEFLYDGAGSCQVDAVYVCLDDDSLSLHTGLTLLQRLRQNNIPILVRLIEEGGLARLLRDREGCESLFGCLRAFGLLDRTCAPSLVLGGTHEILARAIHEEYVQQQEAEGETAETNPSVVPWDALPEQKRESNRRQVDHIGAKLRDVGCGITLLTDWDAASFQFTPEEVEQLARLEHERWCDELRAEGWTHAEGPKDAHARTHPSLVGWEALSESEKEKDRNTVQHLPRFLARTGFQIYRLQETHRPHEIVVSQGAARPADEERTG